ncbi:hypothetical protein MRB53_037913 [Persea americana]|nr:hypothetical protein MRB53_037913 [Persea americana]
MCLSWFARPGVYRVETSQRASIGCELFRRIAQIQSSVLHHLTRAPVPHTNVDTAVQAHERHRQGRHKQSYTRLHAAISFHTRHATHINHNGSSASYRPPRARFPGLCQRIADAEKLEAAGFKKINERQSWSSVLKAGGKYFLTRNATTLVAFTIGKKWRPGNPIAMIGTHVDSCTLRLKPVSKKQADGFLQVGVETYGGGLWHTWFDRDLSMAGRAFIKGKDGTITGTLINVKRPIMRIPAMAPHFGREDPWAINKETQLCPIAGLVSAEVNRQGKANATEDMQVDSAAPSFSPMKAMTERHHPYIVELIAAEAGVSLADVVDFEMQLYDAQPACLGGLNNELVFSARLDNLGMTYCAIEGLISSAHDSGALEDDTTIRLISLFDHEEVGSTSAQGADSDILPSVIRRLCRLPPTIEETTSESSYDKLDDASTTLYEQTLGGSFLISADMNHSINPNYAGKYEPEHKVHMNAGTAVKINVNARYMTNSPGIVLLQEVARLAVPAPAPSSTASTTTQGEKGVPLQLFVGRNDVPCGSTIGPMLASKLGARTIDVGNPQLSMHSIRETCGAYDFGYAIGLFESFFRELCQSRGQDCC